MEWSNDGESQGENLHIRNRLAPNKIELEYKKLTSKHSPYENQQAHPRFIFSLLRKTPCCQRFHQSLLNM
jgi:hypothetical protein